MSYKQDRSVQSWESGGYCEQCHSRFLQRLLKQHSVLLRSVTWISASSLGWEIANFEVGLCKWKCTGLAGCRCEGITGHYFLMLCHTECMPGLAASASVRLSLLLGHLHCSSITAWEVSQWARSQNASSWKATSFYFRVNLLMLCCRWVWSFPKSILRFSVSPFCAEGWSLFMFPLHSLLETVLEAFHFDHETLEKQLVTIDSEGELSAPDGRNATSKHSKCS